MTYRIAVASNTDDARARQHLHALEQILPESGLKAASRIDIYTIDAALTAAQVHTAAERLTNDLIETSTVGDVPLPSSYAWAIEIGFLPGVTDNVGHTARETIEDATGRVFAPGEAVYSSFILFVDGDISQENVRLMAAELHNPLIQRASVYAKGESIPTIVPKVSLHEEPRADEVELNVSDEELARIGKEGIANHDGTRRGPLALSLRELQVIRDHFNGLHRRPTDVELEALAQTWSEHCKHTIFNDPLDEVKEGVYRRYIKGATETIRKAKGKKDFCVSVFKDNAGAIIFDNDHLITHKVETHNAPSALDPFGGSVTAIVGVNRDCLGFGLGARPIANTYGFCVADPFDDRELYRDVQKTQPLLPARRILEGVVHGVNAGGNQSGIPTPLGFVAVDPSYRGKPLVYGGTVGLIPRKLGKRRSYEKKARPGDYIVMVGGRVGLDGIHGATFSSESLSKGSPATAVQIGDPITQKKFSDALVREAREKALYNSITDNGAGGLSGSVGEMAREAGGALVELDQVPLKYPGLSPWQIWVSESQERMTLAVPKGKWTALKKIFDRHGVEATRIGTFTASGKLVVRHAGKTVLDMQMEFLHEGRPIKEQRSALVSHTHEEPSSAQRASDLADAVLEIMARPSIGSISYISQQYDHEVLGMSVTKPLQGRGRVQADAAVIQPVASTQRGVVLSHGYTPWYSQIDTYAMAAAAIDTAIRNAIAAGARREHLAILDNFCWSSSEKPERLYELKEAARACHDTAVAYGTPFISGKDSMFNDFRGFDGSGAPVHIAALPTLLVSTIGVIPDVRRATTIDLKRAGDVLYLIGETNDELGGSEYFASLGHIGNAVPQTDAKANARAYDALTRAIEQGLVASALSVGRGGLAAALCKSAIAGKLGASANFSMLPGTAKAGDAILFSESQGRILVSVPAHKQREFEKLLRGVPCECVGEVTEEPRVRMQLPEADIALDLQALTESYRSFFKDW